MGYTVAAKNEMLSHLSTLATYVALYTDDAGTTEVSGGSPAYARKAVTWNTPSNGVMTASNQPVFDVPAGTTVRAVGLMSASSGGTQYAVADVIDETFGAQGTYTLTSISLDLNG